MCNPSKKTIKRIDRILESKCKECRQFKTDQKQKQYLFRKATDTGFQYAMLLGRAGYFVGVSLDESGEYNFFGILSPEQVWEV